MPEGTLRKRRSEMQIIFQGPVAALDPRMTFGRIVSRPLATLEPGLSRAILNNQAIEALRLVGLSADFAQRYAHELSGGQAQRVGIARAIIGRPRPILCEEPVSALGVSIQAQVVNLLMDLQDQHGLGLVFISHNLAVVRHISHDVMLMCLGRVVESAPHDAFYAKPLHPYSKALMLAVPEPDPKREKGRIGQSLQGELPSVLNPPHGCVFASRCPAAQARCRGERPELRDLGGRQAAYHFVETGMNVHKLAQAWVALPQLSSIHASADGKWAFFCAWGLNEVDEVYAVRTDGSGPPEQLSLGTDHHLIRDVSADGMVLILAQSRHASEHDHLLLLDRRVGNRLHLLTPKQHTHYVNGGKLTRNGRAIIFCTDYDYVNEQVIDGGMVWLQDLTTGARKCLTNTQHFFDRPPSLSPSGQGILLNMNDRSPGSTQLWLINLEGRNLREVLCLGDTNNTRGAWISEDCIAFITDGERSDYLGF